LRLMNLRLDIALRDITGKSGQAIIRAILAGERDAFRLAALADYRVKSKQEAIAQSLQGTWREEHLFALRQHFALYEFLQSQIAECDAAIESWLEQRIRQQEQDSGQARLAYGGIRKRVTKNQLGLDLQTLSYQLTEGVDLSAIDGVNTGTILTLLAEVGTELSQFPSARHFASWLRLAPNRKVSGGKVLSHRTPPHKNRLADAFKHAANAIGNMKKGALAAFFQRIAYKKGRLAAVTATARKLAVIVWQMLTKKQVFTYLGQTAYQAKVRGQQVKHLQRKIKKLGIRPEELFFASP
jgi:transposase